MASKITLMLEDNMILMPKFPDKYFDLAIVDPPYGIGENWKKDKASKFYKHSTSYKNKNVPGKDYFDELFRISKHQIIWGANYFWNYLPPTNKIIWWNKMIDPKIHHHSAGELAWTNISKWPANQFNFSWNGCAVSEPRYGFHPHEKPVALYKWLLYNYAEKGWQIFDSHLGSGSIAIACYDMGFDLVACEIDKEYLFSAVKRFNQHKAQLTLDLK